MMVEIDQFDGISWQANCRSSLEHSTRPFVAATLLPLVRRLAISKASKPRAFGQSEARQVTRN